MMATLCQLLTTGNLILFAANTRKFSTYMKLICVFSTESWLNMHILLLKFQFVIAEMISF